MKSNKGKKFFTTAIATFGSAIVLAGTVNTILLNNNDFMNDQEVQFVKRLDTTIEREVASAKRELVAAQYLPKSTYESVINGKWEITLVTDENENIIFDAESETIVADFKMIGTSLVKIDNDSEMVFDVSLLHESGQVITLFRSFGKGYEILHARKLNFDLEKESPIEVLEAEEVITQRVGEIILNDENRETVLERVLFPSKTSQVIKGRSLEGNLMITEDSIESISFKIEIPGSEMIDVSSEGIELGAGGSFQIEVDGETISGMLSNNGKDGVRVRFISGSFEGAILNFVTEDEKDRILEQEEASRDLVNEIVQEEQPSRDSYIQTISAQDGNARKQIAQDEAELDNEELDEEEFDGEEQISEEDAQIQAEEVGYNF